MSGCCEVCRCTELRACPGGCAWRPGFAAIGIALCTRCSLVLKFPAVPNLANRERKRHWAEQVKSKRAWKATALALEPWLRMKRPRAPLAWAAIEPTILRAGGRAMDPDNAAAALKWALDLLKERGWLVDDDDEHVLLLPVRQVLDPHKIPRLYLTLSDLVPARAGATERVS